MPKHDPEKMAEALLFIGALAAAECIKEMAEEAEESASSLATAEQDANESEAVVRDMREQFEELVRELHAAKHQGHPHSCPEPICRDAWSVIRDAE